MYKIKHALKKGKKVFIMVLILWVLLSIVFIAPISVSLINATENGVLNSGKFTNILFTNFGEFWQCFLNAFKPTYFNTFLKGELYLVCALLFLTAIGLLKSLPKNEYTDIEHGSSDWATGGEQYKILNAKKGIILAEKNYLPVDKRGNTNVLVVGRFWFW